MKQWKMGAAILAAASLVLLGCSAEGSPSFSAPKASGSTVSAAAESPAPGTVRITVPFTRQDGIATNQWAVWVENEQGDFIKTLYVTRFIASGGYKARPEALPQWVARSHTAEKQDQKVDAAVGATPDTGTQTLVWDGRDAKGQPAAPGTYRYFVEGALRWKYHVLYTGSISIGGADDSSEAAAIYEGGDGAEKAMLGKVTASYVSAKGK